MTAESYSDRAHHTYKLKATLAIREDIFMGLGKRVGEVKSCRASTGFESSSEGCSLLRPGSALDQPQRAITLSESSVICF